MYKLFAFLSCAILVAFVSLHFFTHNERPIAPGQYRLYIMNRTDEDRIILSDGSIWKHVGGKKPTAGEVFMKLDGRNQSDKTLTQISWNPNMGARRSGLVAVLELQKLPQLRWAIAKIDQKSLILSDGSKWQLIGNASLLEDWKQGDLIVLSRDFSSPYYGDMHTMLRIGDEWSEIKVLYAGEI